MGDFNNFKENEMYWLLGIFKGETSSDLYRLNSDGYVLVLDGTGQTFLFSQIKEDLGSEGYDENLYIIHIGGLKEYEKISILLHEIKHVLCSIEQCEKCREECTKRYREECAFTYTFQKLKELIDRDRADDPSQYNAKFLDQEVLYKSLKYSVKVIETMISKKGGYHYEGAKLFIKNNSDLWSWTKDLSPLYKIGVK